MEEPLLNTTERPPGAGIGLISVGLAVGCAVIAFLPAVLVRVVSALGLGRDAPTIVWIVGLLSSSALWLLVPFLFIATLFAAFRALRTDESHLARISLAILFAVLVYGMAMLIPSKAAEPTRAIGPSAAECALRAQSDNPCPPREPEAPAPIPEYDPSRPSPRKPGALNDFRERR